MYMEHATIRFIKELKQVITDNNYKSLELLYTHNILITTNNNVKYILSPTVISEFGNLGYIQTSDIDSDFLCKLKDFIFSEIAIPEEGPDKSTIWNIDSNKLVIVDDECIIQYYLVYNIKNLTYKEIKKIDNDIRERSPYVFKLNGKVFIIIDTDLKCSLLNNLTDILATPAEYIENNVNALCDEIKHVLEDSTDPIKATDYLIELIRNIKWVNE